MVSPTLFIESLIDGLVLGGIYAIIALGFSIIFSVAGVLNIAHGDFVMLGALVSFFAIGFFGNEPIYGLLLSLVLVIPLFMALGLVFNIALIKPIAKRPQMEFLVSCILVTIGASFLIEDLTANFVGTLPKGVYLGLGPATIGPITVPLFRLVSLAIVTLITVVFHLFLSKTYVGRAMRAVTQNREVASVLGVNILLISSITFSIGTALAALGGVIYLANGFPITPFIGIPITVKALTVVVLGGVGSITGALIGGIILGIAETLTGVLVSFYWSPAIAILLLLIILMVKPTGLVGE